MPDHSYTSYGNFLNIKGYYSNGPNFSFKLSWLKKELSDPQINKLKQKKKFFPFHLEYLDLCSPYPTLNMNVSLLTNRLSCVCC